MPPILIQDFNISAVKWALFGDVCAIFVVNAGPSRGFFCNERLRYTTELGWVADYMTVYWYILPFFVHASPMAKHGSHACVAIAQTILEVGRQTGRQAVIAT